MLSLQNLSSQLRIFLQKKSKHDEIQFCSLGKYVSLDPFICKIASFFKRNVTTRKLKALEEAVNIIRKNDMIVEPH